MVDSCVGAVLRRCRAVLSGARRRRAARAGSQSCSLYSAAREALEISASVAALRIVADQSNRSNPADAGGAGILGRWAVSLSSKAQSLLFPRQRQTRPDACGDVVYDSSHRSRARRPVQVPFFALGPPRTRDDQATSKERGTSKRAIFLELHLVTSHRASPTTRTRPKQLHHQPSPRTV